MKLTKIKLINWHIFSDNVIDVEGNLLITGDNGNGKSTLIDAIFYVLSGGDEKNFNSAANEESKRTLETYIRGKLGIENKEFLRNEPDVVTHIALEFYDKAVDKSHVLGCVIAIGNSSKPKSKFYIAMDSTVGSLSFSSESDGIFDFNSFKNKNNNSDITDLKDPFVGRRTKIAQFFNITDGKKYYDLLKKAIAFRPINTDVSDFVFQFLLKEDDIRIDSLAQELSEYKEIQRTIEREKEKLACLGTFIDKARQYVAYQRDIRYLTVLKKEADITDIRDEIDKADNKISALVQSVRKAEAMADYYREEIRQTDTDIVQFEEKDELKVIKAKSDRLKILKEQREQLLEEEEDLENLLQFEMELFPLLGIKYDFLKDLKSGNVALLNKHLKEYVSKLYEVKENLRREIINKSNEQSSCDKKNYSLRKELRDISQGRNNYDARTLNFISLIRSKLKERYGRDIPVLPLCECIEITDKSWTDALEGYLNTQKFDLIPPPEYSQAATEIYEQFMKEYGLYGIGVVNTTVKPDATVMENSLYTKIKILNPYADAVCRRLLGRVLCVDNVRQFREHYTCITKTCMTYSNDTARGINPKKYAVPFIGADSIVRRKAILEDELEKQNSASAKLKNEIKEAEIKLATLERSKSAKLTEREIPDYLTDIKFLGKSIDDLESEIKVRSQCEDIVRLSDELEKLKQKKKGWAEKLTEVNEEREKNEIMLQEQRGKRSLNAAKLSEAEQDYRADYDSLEDVEDFNTFKAEFNCMQGNPAPEIDRRLRVNNNNQEAIKRGMREYSREYNANLTDDIACINDFIAEYNKINDTGLALNEANAAEAFKNAQMAFNENFVSMLRDKIKCAKTELDRINDNLKRHPFGRDLETYEFKIRPSGDREMREYARIIMSGKEMDRRDLFTETLDSRDREIMQGLFDRLAAISNAAQSEKDLNKYLDYRQYFQYDILIRNKNEEQLYFSKISKEKSGGEMQTPFYVVIGSCFDELIKRDERISSACIVAFDEAFNNMDESRIITLMNYYKQLNIQLIIVVPTNHSQGIIPYIDTVVSLIKKNNHIYETYLFNE